MDPTKAIIRPITIPYTFLHPTRPAAPSTSIPPLQAMSRRKSLGNHIDGIGKNRSDESILPLQSNAITKTTVVTVDRSEPRGHSERTPWAKKLDISPKREIEDRV
jgi:hypothetical protein